MCAVVLLLQPTSEPRMGSSDWQGMDSLWILRGVSQNSGRVWGSCSTWVPSTVDLAMRWVTERCTVLPWVVGFGMNLATWAVHGGW